MFPFVSIDALTSFFLKKNSGFMHMRQYSSLSRSFPLIQLFGMYVGGLLCIHVDVLEIDCLNWSSSTAIFRLLITCTILQQQ